MNDKAKCKNCTNEMIEEIAKDIHRVCTACSGEMFDEYTCDRCQAKLLIEKGYRKIPEGSVVLDRHEAQKYFAYKHIEPQIKGCLDRERELEKQLKQNYNSKEIEEMASDMNFACVKHDLYPDDAKEIAKALVILGYRNCKDKMVLRKEEYGEYVELRNSKVGELVKENRELGKQCLDWMKLYHKQLTQTDEARKETAKEIFTTIDHLIINDRATPLWVKDVLIELAKQFGVEVEE